MKEDSVISGCQIAASSLEITELFRKKLLDRVTSEEIKKASFGTKPFKAPRPDGFQPSFKINGWRSVQVHQRCF